MIVPVLITPFKDDGSIDYDSLESLIDKLDQEGAKEYWVFGTGGEDWALSGSTRKSILKFLASKFDDKDRFIIGVGNLCLTEAIILLQEALQLGFTRYHYIQTNRMLSNCLTFLHLEKLVSISTEVRMWGYFSNNFCRDLSYEDFAESKDFIDSRMEGIKHSTNNLQALARIKSEARTRILPAKAAQLIETLKLGFGEITSVEACIHLRLLNEIIEEFHMGNVDNAIRIHKAYLSKSSTMSTDSRKHNFVNVSELKYTLWRLGILNSPTVSAELMPLSETDKLELDKVIERDLM